MQGRLRSTRLPAKGFFTFFGQTIWERMCDIALAIDGVDEVVFATGDLPENQLMRPLIEAKGVRFLVGSEDNVLERYCQAIDGSSAEYLLRLTCDNYLVQPEVIEEMYSMVFREDYDYAFVSPLSHFAGEFVRCEVLRESFKGNYSDKAKEHVTWDIRHSTVVNLLTFPSDYLGLDHANSPTLDTLDDFIRMKNLECDCGLLREVRCLDALRELQSGNTLC